MKSTKRHIFTFFCLIVFTGLIALCIWQVQRLQWKTALINELDTKLSQEPVPLDLSKSVERFQRMEITGELLHGYEIHLAGKYNAKEIGYHVITPMQLENTKLVLINRGWIPAKKKERNTRANTLTDGIITLQGTVREGDKPWSVLPQNQPQQNMWLWANIEQIQTYLRDTADLEVEPILIYQTSSPPGERQLPIPFPVEIKLRNDHMEYALTWSLLALIILVMYLVWLRKQGRI